MATLKQYEKLRDRLIAAKAKVVELEKQWRKFYAEGCDALNDNHKQGGKAK
jgi:phage terminase large subunit-like protein